MESAFTTADSAYGSGMRPLGNALNDLRRRMIWELEMYLNHALSRRDEVQRDGANRVLRGRSEGIVTHRG